MFSQQAMKNLTLGHSVQIPVQDELGVFNREEENLLVFSTPVLDQVDYIPPTLEKYVKKSLEDPSLQAVHLFILFDEQKKTFFLEGLWDLNMIKPHIFTNLIMQIREIAYEVKQDIYKALCQDLVYVLAQKSQNR